MAGARLPHPSRARLLERRLGLLGEMLVLGVVDAVWELARVPAKGSLALSLAHARTWVSLERFLHLNGEATLIRMLHHPHLLGVAHWFYVNGDEPFLFAFMAAVYFVAPDRYPRLRTTFALMHLPALAVIWLYPLAPPRWVSALPFGNPPSASVLTGLENSTAAAASLHFGDAAFVAAAALWIAPRSRLAWALLAYPALTLFVIVGTANHYFLDAIVGASSLALGASAARFLHGAAPRRMRLPRLRRRSVLVAMGATGLLTYGINLSIFGRLLPDRPSSATFALALGALLALVALRRERAEGRFATGPAERAR